MGDDAEGDLDGFGCSEPDAVRAARTSAMTGLAASTTCLVSSREAACFCAGGDGFGSGGGVAAGFGGAGAGTAGFGGAGTAAAGFGGAGAGGFCAAGGVGTGAEETGGLGFGTG